MDRAHNSATSSGPLDVALNGLGPPVGAAAFWYLLTPIKPPVYGSKKRSEIDVRHRIAIGIGDTLAGPTAQSPARRASVSTYLPASEEPLYISKSDAVNRLTARAPWPGQPVAGVSSIGLPSRPEALTARPLHPRKSASGFGSQPEPEKRQQPQVPTGARVIAKTGGDGSLRRSDPVTRARSRRRIRPQVLCILQRQTKQSGIGRREP